MRKLLTRRDSRLFLVHSLLAVLVGVAIAGVGIAWLVVAMALVTACCGVWLSTRRAIERAATPALA